MALPRSGSSSGAFASLPAKEYRPSSSRFGHGASTCPRPADDRSSAVNPSTTREPPISYDRSVAPTSVITTRWSPCVISCCAPVGSKASRIVFTPPSSTAGAVAQDLRRRDQRQVRKRLRRVPDQPVVHLVVLLGEQAEVALEREQPVEQRLSLVAATDQREVDHQPEAAGEERALAWRETVGGVLVGDVPHHEPVLDQIALDRLDGPDDARILWRQKADLRDQQQRRIELIRPVELRERVAFRVEALTADLLVHRGRDLRQLVDLVLEPGLHGELE